MRRLLTGSTVLIKKTTIALILFFIHLSTLETLQQKFEIFYPLYTISITLTTRENA